MVNREYSTRQEEAALESHAPSIDVRQEGYSQGEPEQEVAESDSVAEDPTSFSYQYAAWTDMGG